MINPIKKNPAIYILLTVSMIIGAIIAPDYGESVDENLHITYAESTLTTYKQVLQGNFSYRDFRPTNLRYYGPAYNMVTYTILNLFPGLDSLALGHFTYFVAFQIGVVSFYFIVKRVMNVSAAFIATLLFTSQPLFWGQAFVNPKDPIFMGFTLASVAVGLSMLDQLDIASLPTPPQRTPLKQTIRSDWQALSTKAKQGLIIFSTVCLILILVFTVGQNWIKGLAEQFTLTIYHADPGTFLGRLFTTIAQNRQSIPAENYVNKAIKLVEMISVPVVLVLVLIPMARTTWVLPNVKEFTLSQTRQFAAEIGQALKHPILWAAGFILGFTTAIRLAGPIAGTLVAIYALLKFKKKALGPVLAYALIGMAATYLLWPYLWSAPITHFMKSLTVLSDFPWPGGVLFQGVHYTPDQLPRSYLPTLIALQFTEPAIPLALVGIFITLKRKQENPLSYILLAWFLVPFIYMLINPISLYDNFRQLLFIMPPIFIAAGWAIEIILNKLSKPLWQYLLALLLILPGLYAIIQLHPYEYMYYNSFDGGVPRAFRYYETEYWATSYKKAAEWLNENAPPGAKIVAFGSAHLVIRSAHPDLIIEHASGGTYNLETGYDYAVIHSRWDDDIELFPDAPVIHTIESNGVIMTVIKELNCPPADSCSLR